MTSDLARPISLDTINLLGDDDLFLRYEQHEAFSLLRREDPVHWNPGNEYVKGWWDITKYEDVLHVSRHTEIFSSEGGITMYEPRDADSASAAAAGNGKMLITMDPPRHVRLRRLVNKGFTPRAENAMESHIRTITNQLLDDVAGKDNIDFVTEVAANLPLAVICEMMGVPREDWNLMFTLTNKVLGPADPEYQTDVPEEQRGTPDAARTTGNIGTMQMFGYFTQAVMERRTTRTEDLVSLLIDSEVDAENLSDEDILWFCFLLILAGNETTRNGISGGLLTLCEHPEQRARLQGDLVGSLPVAVEELLRWVSPVMHMARVATQDAEIRGRKIAKGDRVVLWYPSVNRDEDMFVNPNTLDLLRTPNEHLAFGIGEHFCLGAGFARMELRVMFEELFTRFPKVQVNGPVERLKSTFIGGIKHLPVSLNG